MKTCKVFIVGPHDAKKYGKLKRIVQSSFEDERADSAFAELIVTSPVENPGGDDMNRWIFAQIDTCDVLLADISGFNPNVVYEIAFAHAIGTPIIYVMDTKDSKNDRESIIRHYWNFSLISRLKKTDYEKTDGTSLHQYLKSFFRTGSAPIESVMTNYYGLPPIDSEFARGIATGYFKNFLSRLIALDQLPERAVSRVIVAIPDTLAVSYQNEARNKVYSRLDLDADDVAVGINRRTGRRLNAAYSARYGIVYDFPSALFTLTDCTRYQRAFSAPLTELDRDRIVDRLTRKFVDEIIRLRGPQPEGVGAFDGLVEFRWLGEIVPDWAPPSLLNPVPLKQFDGKQLPEFSLDAL